MKKRMTYFIAWVDFKIIGIRLGIFIASFSIIPIFALSQINGRYPVTVTMFNQGVSAPFTKVISRPIHPGIMIETNQFFKGGASSWGFNVSIGYYFHRHLAHGVFIQSHILFRSQTKSAVYGQVLVGTGYLIVFRTETGYKLQNGQYIRSKSLGKSRITPSIAVEVGSKLKKHEVLSPSVFTRYQTWIQYPFSPGFIPFLSHTNLHIGYTFYKK